MPDVVFEAAGVSWDPATPEAFKNQITAALNAKGWGSAATVVLLDKEAIALVIRCAFPKETNISPNESEFLDDRRSEANVWLTLAIKRTITASSQKSGAWQNKCLSSIGAIPSTGLECAEAEKMAENLTHFGKMPAVQNDISGLLRNALQWVSTLVCLVSIAGFKPDGLVALEFLEQLIGLYEESR
jgi:hypothetical protein